MQIHPKGENTKLKKNNNNITTAAATATFGDEFKMAKLLRERNTAQRRRQCKREELTTLGLTIQDLEARFSKLQIQIEKLSDIARKEVYSFQARYGTPSYACRLCSVLERREEFSLDRLLLHLKTHHASELRHRGQDAELIRFCTEIPAEDAELSDEESNSDDDSTSNIPESDNNSLEAKRKIRLKRNAASARKSRRRKRVQLERWRMMLPILRFQVESLEAALNALPNLVVCDSISMEAEPDVISAAFALIGCSLSARTAMV